MPDEGLPAAYPPLIGLSDSETPSHGADCQLAGRPAGLPLATVPAGFGTEPEQGDLTYFLALIR